METPPVIQRKAVPWTAAVIAAAVALLALVWALDYFWPKKDSEYLNVPLGVEQAAIVTYSGPPVAVAPYKWGVAVNVRIARVTEQPAARVYDVRYIVNRAGTFDLKDYLISENGMPLDGLPSFKFQGDPKLSKQLEARIQETEELTVDVGGHYYVKLASLAVLWIVWLLLLIFYGRAKKPQEAAPPPPLPTLAELLRGFLVQLEAGTLDSTAKARMEMLLLKRLREDMQLAGMPMDASMEALIRDEKTGGLLRQLQHWMHHPASHVRREDIATLLTPYTLETRRPEEATAS